MPFQNINGINLYYEQMGQGDPLVLVAGYTCDISQWDSIKEALSKKFSLLMVDNRGVGRSDVPNRNYSISLFAEDLILLTEKLGIDRFHLLGHSMGGAIVQEIALKSPKRCNKLIIANSAARFSTTTIQAMEFFLTLRQEGLSNTLITKGLLPWLYSNPFLQNPDNINRAIALFSKYPYPQKIAGQQYQLEALKDFDSRSWVNKIKHPTLIIGSSHDLLAPETDSLFLQKNILNSQYYSFDQMGHLPLIEKPKEFVQLIINFIKN